MKENIWADPTAVDRRMHYTGETDGQVEEKVEVWAAYTGMHGRAGDRQEQRQR